jgi:ubiquinone/menaquinone biosynthesis C-methylase UbiE
MDTPTVSSSEWSGIRGKIGAWYLNSPLRRLAEILIFGDLKSEFMEEAAADIQGHETILDVGAGSGYFSLALAARLTTGTVICLDLSREMLDRLERLARREGSSDRIRIVTGDACHIEIEDVTVDLAVANNVLHELSQPGAALGEMVRVLKPGGKAIVTDFGVTWLGKRVAAAHAQEDHGPFTMAELQQLLANAGLKDVQVTTIRHWVMGVGTKT